MKKILLFTFIIFFAGCNEKEMSHTETAEIVAESFYQGDNDVLKKHTTAESYAILSGLLEMFQNESEEVHFKVVADTVIGEVAWVRYTTSNEEKPGVFN